jgi:glycosyltransferase involved in cell wall biosynthesis
VFSTFTAAGPQLRIAGLFRYLGAQFRHTIVAMDGCFDAAYALDASLEVALVRPPPKTHPIAYFFAIRRMLTRLQPDLLVTYNWGSVESVVAGQMGRFCPIIHNEHGFGPDEAERLKTRRVLARRVVLPRIFKTIVPSRNLLRIALEQYRLTAAKVQFIASGVDTNAFSPTPVSKRQSAGLVFGYVGQLRPEKNLELLLRSFAASGLETALLLVVGDGPLRAILERVALDLGIFDRVTFAGAVRDVRPWYSRFDVFVLSSVTEQTPMSLLEAMACGLPAICTDVGDCATILGTSHQPEIVPSRDARRMADSMRTMSNPALRATLSVKNRRRAVESFSAARMYRAYEAVYRAALASNAHR